MTAGTLQVTTDSARQIAGVRVWRKADPVFSSGLAARNDESEWRRVMYDPVAASSNRAITIGVLSQGWELRPRRETPAAKLLAEVGRAVINSLVGPAPGAEPGSGLTPLLWELPRALTEGWLPLQLEWSGVPGGRPAHLRVNGRMYPSIWKVVAHPQEYFWASLEGHLVFQGGGATVDGRMNQPQVFKGAEAQNWMSMSVGATRSPYGRPLASIIWPSWYVKNMQVQWRDRTARSSILGVPVIEEGVGLAGRPLNFGEGEGGRVGDIRDADIQAAIDRASRIFDDYGWVFIPRGWNLKQLASPGAGEAWQKLIDYHDTRIKLILEGQELAAEMPSSGVGSYAASKTAENTKLTYVQSQAGDCAQTLTSIVARVLVYNFDPDPEDLPLWVFGVQQQLDKEKLAAFLGGGGKVDGLAVAKLPDWKIPIPDGVTEMVLSRQDTALPGVPPPNPTPPLPFGRVSQARADSLERTWERLNDIEEALAAERLEVAQRQYSGHMGRLEAAVLDATEGDDPDPKA